MWLYRVNRALGPVLGAYWGLGIRGAVESIPRFDGLLVVPNHSSFLDPWMVGMSFPRPIRWLITSRWYRRSRTSHFFFRAFGTIPVRPRDPSGTVRAVCDALGRGEVVGVFPEGRISEDGRIHRLRAGIALMAARSGAPVVPVGVRGSFESLPKHRRVPRPQRVTVVVGRPLRFPGSPVDGTPSEADANRFLASLRDEISRLSGRELADAGRFERDGADGESAIEGPSPAARPERP